MCVSIVYMQFVRSRPLAITLLATGGGSYAYYRYSKRKDDGANATTFRILLPQVDANGRRVLGAVDVPYLPDATLEQRVKLFSKKLYPESSISSTINTIQPSSPSIQFSGAQLGSNQPVEDMEPEAIVYSYADGSKKPIIVAAVADGHSGPHTSQFLKGRLSTMIIGTLLMNAKLNTLVFPPPNIENGTVIIPSTFKLDLGAVSPLIRKSFESLDKFIVHLKDEELIKMPQRTILGLDADSLKQRSILPAYSGACALATVIDMEGQHLWVASTGDCRAVGGFWDEKPDGTGVWRVDVLSQDQTGDNPSEQARIIKEHPLDNPAQVISRGRILGSLQPSRAFGDLRYKWSVEDQKNLLPSLLPSGMKIRSPPVHSHTPPYVTASPDIQYRKFELPSSSPSVSRRTLRFIILATDGLWDEISNAQAVALVGGHLAGYRGTIPALQITKQIPTEDTTTASKLATPPAATNTNILSSSNGSSLAYLNATAMPHLMPHSAQKVRNIDWAFRDESIVMHLIRNAIGGTDDIKIRQSLSIPSPYTRRHRDDITVAVITFDGPDSHTVNAKVKAKAKL